MEAASPRNPPFALADGPFLSTERPRGGQPHRTGGMPVRPAAYPRQPVSGHTRIQANHLLLCVASIQVVEEPGAERVRVAARWKAEELACLLELLEGGSRIPHESERLVQGRYADLLHS